MEIKELKNKEEKIRLLIEKLSDVNAERYPIYDGINDIDQYLKAKYKILFVLKEPYDEENGEGGNWDIKELLGKGGYGKASKTFYPLIYIAYGILNGFQTWNDMEYVEKNFEEMNKSLYQVSYINISKLPSLNVTKTDFNDIVNAYEMDKKNDNIILTQIDSYEPDIIIGFGIGEILTADLVLKCIDDDDFYYSDNINGCTSKKYPNTLYIAAYHPAQTKMQQPEYVDSIIRIAKNWVNKKNIDTMVS